MFPSGGGVEGEVEQQNDFDDSSKDNLVEARDRDTRLPVWLVEVLEFDSQAGTKRYRVKVTGQAPMPGPEPVGNTGLTLHPLPVGMA